MCSNNAENPTDNNRPETMSTCAQVKVQEMDKNARMRTVRRLVMVQRKRIVRGGRKSTTKVNSKSLRQRLKTEQTIRVEFCKCANETATRLEYASELGKKENYTNINGHTSGR